MNPEIPFDAQIISESPTMHLGFKTQEVSGRRVRILHQKVIVVWRPARATEGEEVTHVWQPVPTLEE
jgi:hypothetical protein